MAEIEKLTSDERELLLAQALVPTTPVMASSSQSAM
jgi:hypothetical protein